MLEILGALVGGFAGALFGVWLLSRSGRKDGSPVAVVRQDDAGRPESLQLPVDAETLREWWLGAEEEEDEHAWR